MNFTKQLLVYFKPSIKISKFIENLNIKISEKFRNNYRSYVDGKWESHLMVFLGRFPEENINKAREAIEAIIDNLKSFKVPTTNIRTDENYIFLDIDKASEIECIKIHELLIKNLNFLRDRSISNKYKERWSTLTDRQKYLVETSGLPYEYIPHFTIVRLLEEKGLEVVEKLEIDSPKSMFFEANKLKIAIEESSRNSDWKTLKTFNLK